MSAKDKKKGKGAAPASAEAMRQEVRRLIGKEHFKDAVKQAKLCVKEHGTDEDHRLLEQAYLRRAEQLRREGMPASAQEVARHLLDHGVNDPEVRSALADLLVRIGMAAEALALGGSQPTPELQGRLARAALDHAVLHPDRVTAAVPADVRAAAKTARAALEALAAGDEAPALAALRDVPRQSPLADWRLFVRGLAAYQRRDDAEMLASWDRLEPGRAPAAIALVLRGIAGHGAGQPTPPVTVAAGLTALERAALGETAIAELLGLRNLAAAGRWPEVIRALPALNIRLRRIDPALPERLTRAIYDPLLRAAMGLSYRDGTALLRQFAAAAEPPALDPKWNRLWAMAWEGAQGSLDDALPYWRKYVDDLATVPALPAEERPLAQALIWHHLAELAIADVAEIEGDDDPVQPPRAESASLRKRAVEWLERCLELAPAHRPALAELYQVHARWHQPAKAVAAARRLLDAYPDDLDTLIFLADHHLQGEEPVEALEFIRRARAARPLDPRLTALEWLAHMRAARLYALRKRWDEGRAEFAAADRLQAAAAGSVQETAMKAAFEIKAKDQAAADALIAQAQGKLDDPAPLWLALHVEAVRFALPKAEKDRAAARLKQALAGKLSPAGVGGMAQVMNGLLASRLEYSGRATHIKQVLDAIKRVKSKAAAFTADDLRQVCTLLDLQNKEVRTLDALLARGLKQFPDSVYFLATSGRREVDKGPYRCNRPRARDLLERARARAEASSEPFDRALLPQIKEDLTLLAEHDDGPFGFGFGGPFGFRFPFAPPRGRGAGRPPAPTPAELEELFDELGLDGMGDADEDEPIDDGPAPAPAPRRPATPGKAKRRRR